MLLATLGVGAISYAWNFQLQVDRTWGERMGVPGLKGRTLTQYCLTVLLRLVGGGHRVGDRGCHPGGAVPHAP